MAELNNFFAIFIIYAKGEVRLKPGSHDFTFQSNLSLQIPSSFEGEKGFVRYKACVVLCTSKQSNEEFETFFTVIKTINLNDDPKFCVSSWNYFQFDKLS